MRANAYSTGSVLITFSPVQICFNSANVHERGHDGAGSQHVKDSRRRGDECQRSAHGDAEGVVAVPFKVVKRPPDGLWNVMASA